MFNFVILAVTTFFLNGTHGLRQVSRELFHNSSGQVGFGLVNIPFRIFLLKSYAVKDLIMGNRIREKVQYCDIVAYLGCGATDGADVHGCSMGSSIVNLSSFAVRKFRSVLM